MMLLLLASSHAHVYHPMSLSTYILVYVRTSRTHSVVVQVLVCRCRHARKRPAGKLARLKDTSSSSSSSNACTQMDPKKEVCTGRMQGRIAGRFPGGASWTRTKRGGLHCLVARDLTDLTLETKEWRV